MTSASFSTETSERSRRIRISAPLTDFSALRCPQEKPCPPFL
jgi:hypothetical protein